MTSFIKFLSIFILQGALALSVSSVDIKLIDIDDHLFKYDKFNISEHDNIDDSPSTHTHGHKHSKDGEEHEHEHKHLKISQFEILKFQYLSKSVLSRSFSYRLELRFREVIHLSTAHLPDVFRPPIV